MVLRSPNSYLWHTYIDPFHDALWMTLAISCVVMAIGLGIVSFRDKWAIANYLGELFTVSLRLNLFRDCIGRLYWQNPSQ